MDDVSVPAWTYQYLGMGRTTQDLPDETLAALLQRLSVKADGLDVAIEVLSMHIYDNHNPTGPRVKQLARTLLANLAPSKSDPSMDHALGRLITYFLADEQAEPVARRMLQSLSQRMDDYALSRYDLTETLAALFQVQPMTALETLVGDEADDGAAYYRRRELAGGRRLSALSKVPPDTLIAWCEQGPESRWVNVAPLVPAFAGGGEHGPIRWSDGVLALLRRAPHPEQVAAAIVDLIRPMSWSGLRSEAIKQRLPLLDALERELGPEHAALIARWRDEASQDIAREMRRELDEHKSRNERFE